MDDQIALRLVPELQRYGLAGFDLGGLGRIIQKEALSCTSFLYNQCRIGIDVLMRMVPAESVVK